MWLLYVRALVCCSPVVYVGEQVLRGVSDASQEMLSVCWNDVFSGGRKDSSCPFPAPGELHPPRDPGSLLPGSQREAPIDARHRSSEQAADWLQLYNDDKSHKQCQRHSDSKKHPLKIHPGHVASYFKHSPTPHLGPEFLRRRLITVVITSPVPHLF